MTILGWSEKYAQIRKEFGYDYNDDIKSAHYLDLILNDQDYSKLLSKILKDSTVFVLGAGPSLVDCIFKIKQYDTIKIAADGATQAILEQNLIPEIVVTDLDGDIQSLKTAANRGSLMVVHAHGDNIDKLKIVNDFPKCLGTTQTEPIGNIHNFGGFTDGDRCVFLASHFKAKNIILAGMDFGKEIGQYSKHKIIDRELKIKKLRQGEVLLQWLIKKSNSKIYTMSDLPKGIEKITMSQLNNLINKI